MRVGKALFTRKLKKTSSEQKEDNLINAKQGQETKIKKGYFACKIRLLSDAQPLLEFKLSKSDVGLYVFNLVCDNIERSMDCSSFRERDYFGLRYTDKHNQRQWLDMDKPLYKQLKDCKSYSLSFRVKHYPMNPMNDLKQEISRYLLYQQILRDLKQGRLLCPPSIVAVLGALVVQSIIGDAPVNINDAKVNADLDGDVETLSHNADTKNYLRGLTIFEEITPSAELAIIEEHKKLRGLTTEEAVNEILMRAPQLKAYGIDPFPVIPLQKLIPSKPPVADNQTNESGDQTVSNKTETHVSFAKNTKFYLGIVATGLISFVGVKPSFEYHWDEIKKMGCDGPIFFFHLNREKSHDTVLRFKCLSNSASLAIWHWAVDQKCFFTLKNANEAKKLRSSSKLFSRSHTYRFSGRSQREITADKIESTKLDYTRLASLRHNINLGPGFERRTLPARIRPSLDMKESFLAPLETIDHFESSVTIEEDITPAVVAHTTVEQSLEESTSAKQITVDELEPVTEINESAVTPLIQPTVITQQMSPMSYIAEKTPEEPSQVDYIAVESDDQQAVSALDRVINEHKGEGFFANVEYVESSTVPSTSVNLRRVVNGLCKYDNRESSPLESNKHVINGVTVVPESCHSFIAHPSVTVTAVTIAVVVGIVVLLEISHTPGTGFARLLRRNVVVHAINNYAYDPLRNAIFTFLGALW